MSVNANSNGAKELLKVIKELDERSFFRFKFSYDNKLDILL